MAHLRTEEISTIFEREEMAAGSVLPPRSGDVTFRTEPKNVSCCRRRFRVNRTPVTYKLIVLDFDGTFTNVEAEADPFFKSYKDDVRSTLNIRDLDVAWDTALATLSRDPAHYGWSFGGQIVAPGNVDPYLRATVVLNMILDERALVRDPQARSELLSSLYRRNYPKAATVFRDEAKFVVETLLDSKYSVVVVTNSEISAVQSKLDKLNPQGREHLRVFGDAKKFILQELNYEDDLFDTIPQKQIVEGLRRPIFLRRGHYYTCLRALWNELEVSPQETFVVGDIYELDLALPAALGAGIHLVLKETTERFEKDAVQAYQWGEVSNDLAAILPRVEL